MSYVRETDFRDINNSSERNLWETSTNLEIYVRNRRNCIYTQISLFSLSRDKQNNAT